MKIEEEEEEEVYISNENDPENPILIVPEDDYVIDDGEKKMEHEIVMSTIKARNEIQMKNHDLEMDEKLFQALLKGELK